jgi:chromatin remodeling complex protein RSC6
MPKSSSSPIENKLNSVTNEKKNPEKKVRKIRVSKKVKKTTEPVVENTTTNVATAVVETPVVETPVVETPVVETPVVENITSNVETPVVETPVVENTSTNVATPVVETPINETTTTLEPNNNNLNSLQDDSEENLSLENQDKKKKKKSVKKEDFIPRWEFLFDAYAAELKNAKKQPNQQVSLLKYLTALKNDTYKFMKLRRRKETDKSSGFLKPVAISEELEQFIGETQPPEQITRVYITQKLCNYIKQMDLQNPEDKRMILPDHKLKKLFDMKEDEQEKLTYYSLQQKVQRHIYKL